MTYEEELVFLQAIRAYCTTPGQSGKVIGAATGEFTWHPDAATLIETCDFSDSPAMQHILRKLWDHEQPVKRKHTTDGTPCWCNPETTYTDPDTGASVVVHNDADSP